MIIQKLMISAGVLLGTFCLHGMQENGVLTKEQQQLLERWNIDKGGMIKRNGNYPTYASINNYLAFPLQEKLKNIVDQKDIDRAKKEFKEILSIVLKNNPHAGYSFIQNFIKTDFISEFFAKKTITIEEFIPVCAPHFLPEKIDGYLVKSAWLMNYFIYNRDLRIIHPEKENNTLALIKSNIMREGFCVGNEFYTGICSRGPGNHLKKQTPKSRVNYFKMMLKPTMSQEIQEEVSRKNVTFMLCLNRLVKEKKLFSKVPKPILLNGIIVPSFPDKFHAVCKNVQAVVSEYSELLGNNYKEEDDLFLCNDFDQWYAHELKECMKN